MVSNDLLNELKKLEQNGVLDANKVVQEARAESSPLHPHFDWDDETAANKWRLTQARKLISNIRLKVIDPHTQRMVYVPRYIHLNEDGTGYRALQKVIKDRHLRTALVAQMEKDLRSWQRKYESIKDYVDQPELFAVIDEFLKSRSGAPQETWRDYLAPHNRRPEHSPTRPA